MNDLPAKLSIYGVCSVTVKKSTFVGAFGGEGGPVLSTGDSSGVREGVRDMDVIDLEVS